MKLENGGYLIKAINIVVPVATREPIAYLRHAMEANCGWHLRWLRCNMHLILSLGIIEPSRSAASVWADLLEFGKKLPVQVRILPDCNREASPICALVLLFQLHSLNTFMYCTVIGGFAISCMPLVAALAHSGSLPAWLAW